MGLLDRLGLGRGADPALERRRAEDVARIEAGGVPQAGEQRLRELAAGGTAFTSELSVAGFALTRLDAVRPVCQVMGSSVYQVGWQSYPWGSWGADGVATELDALSAAWNDARGRALERLRREAELAGCHAVIGVTFDARGHDFLSDEIEIVVRGTAVHLPEGAERPVLTDLSLADYTLLRRAGYAPVGVVTASSVWYVVPSWRTQQATRGLFQPNQELADFTQGVYAARETAIGRVTARAEALGADGLVGVSIEQRLARRETGGESSRRTNLIVTFHVTGTAIVARGEARPLDVRAVVRQGAS